MEDESVVSSITSSAGSVAAAVGRMLSTAAFVSLSVEDSLVVDSLVMDVVATELSGDAAAAAVEE